MRSASVVPPPAVSTAATSLSAVFKAGSSTTWNKGIHFYEPAGKIKRIRIWVHISAIFGWCIHSSLKLYILPHPNFFLSYFFPNFSGPFFPPALISKKKRISLYHFPTLYSFTQPWYFLSLSKHDILSYNLLTPLRRNRTLYTPLLLKKILLLNKDPDPERESDPYPHFCHK